MVTSTALLKRSKAFSTDPQFYDGLEKLINSFKNLTLRSQVFSGGDNESTHEGSLYFSRCVSAPKYRNM